MNFCGGAVELQVHEAPIVSLGQQHHSSVDDDLQHHHHHHGGQQYHHHVDLPVHPSCMVKTSQPQNTSSTSSSTYTKGSSKTAMLRITKKKLQQPQQQHQHNLPTTTLNNNTPPPNNNKSSVRTPPSRSRSRSRSSRGSRKIQPAPAEDGMTRMEIVVTPARQTTNNNHPSTRSSPSPRMLNPLSPQRIAVHNNNNSSTPMDNGPGLIGLSSFSNMKTLDTLLKRLENGFRVVSQSTW
jgi:hypothetical protein